MKLEKEINKILTNFFDNINDFNYLNFKMDSDFGYSYLTDTIYYSIIISEKMDNYFMEYALNNGLAVDCGIFILSLFHEIGHAETFNELTCNEVNYSYDMKLSLTDSKEDCFIYFDLPDEKKATLWAVNYINIHNNELKELSNSLEKILKNY